jgi:hypothetical protein
MAACYCTSFPVADIRKRLRNRGLATEAQY